MPTLPPWFRRCRVLSIAALAGLLWLPWVTARADVEVEVDAAAWLERAGVEARRVTGRGPELTDALQVKGELLAAVAARQAALGLDEPAERHRQIVRLCRRALAHDGEDGWVIAAQAWAAAAVGDDAAAGRALAELINPAERAWAEAWLDGGAVDGFPEEATLDDVSPGFRRQVRRKLNTHAVDRRAGFEAGRGDTALDVSLSEVPGIPGGDPARRAFFALGVAEARLAPSPVPALAAEPGMKTEPEPESEPELEPEPVVQARTDADPQPAIDPEPAGEDEARAEPEVAASAPAPAPVQTEPLAVVEPAADAAVVVEAAPVVEPTPPVAAEHPMASEPAAVAELPEPIAESSAPIAEPSEPIVETVAEPEPAETMQAVEVPAPDDDPAAAAETSDPAESVEATEVTEAVEADPTAEAVAAPPVAEPADPADNDPVAAPEPAPAIAPVVPDLRRLADPAAVLDDAPAPAVYDVEVVTTRGVFTVRVTRAWAPAAADRFYDLARSGYYHNQRFFRVVEGFVVQWGIHGFPRVAEAWRPLTFPDEPRRRPNVRGTIAFAAADVADSRNTQVFVNLGDHAFLDELGFAPFGRVTAGLDVVESLFAGHGDAPSQQQPRIQREGNAFLDATYPELDSVVSVSVTPAAE
ncbi:MAG: peptidylprolyl isomerase [Planctomycetota bacterium]